MSISISFLASNSTQTYECLCHVPSYAALHYLPTVDVHCLLDHLMLLYLASMSSSGNPFSHRPCNVFIAMGHCWVLEVEFSYPIDSKLRNSARVHNTMRQEWAWLLREQEMFYDELVGYKLPVPRRLASQMLRDTIDELYRALNRIREENNRMKIRLNRY